MLLQIEVVRLSNSLLLVVSLALAVVALNLSLCIQRAEQTKAGYFQKGSERTTHCRGMGFENRRSRTT
jgi:hypothetical protein